MKRQRDFVDLCEWQAPSPLAFRDICSKFHGPEEQQLRSLLRAFAPPPTESPEETKSLAPVAVAVKKDPTSSVAKPTSALSKLLAMAKSKQKGTSSFPLQTTSSIRHVKSPTGSTHSDQGQEQEQENDPQSANVTSSRATSNGDKRPEQLTYEEFMKTQARAPRKGEIGITAAEVEKIEALGYVMSGSRNPMAQKRIEALQRQVHEKQAAKLSLDFVAESDRRMDEKTIDDLFNLL